MNTKSLSLLLLLLLMASFASGYLECPTKCTCNLDVRGRIQTICNRGGMTSIPILEMDTSTEALIIRGPRNDLTIGPMFLPLKRLEILRITDSNLPSVGTYSFWGVERLRILGKINRFIQHNIDISLMCTLCHAIKQSI